jgi:NADH-quinone oxidoreductase subunit G/[NiFe] hydrogenase diaphorase moiety small subunit
VLKLYAEFLTDRPCGEVSRKYLHTHYTSRGDYLV